MARAIDTYNEAHSLGSTLNRLHRNGALENMAKAGWGTYDIQGFEQIADYLIATCGEQATS